MFGSHRSGDISYYEELGVAGNATAEEVRDAFRSLVRLLHPDQQTDPQLKETAERQMRKLNRIYAVLSDPERRRRYDELLEDEYPHIVINPQTPPDLRPIVTRVAWGGAIVLVAVVLFWVWFDDSGGVRTRSPNSVEAAAPAYTPRKTAEPQPSNSDEAVKLRADLKSVTAQRDAAIRELARLRGAPIPDAGSRAPRPATAQSSSAAPSLPTITELPSTKAPFVPRPVALPTVAPAPPVRRESAAGNTFAGFWFYVKPPAGQLNKNRTLYPPEFIEANITEENGVVQGKYRSRFQIVDRAISPDVNFSFAGPAGSSSPYSWSGPGGAKGELTLKITAENQLRVEWTANELGSQQGLASGTAVLKRRLDQ